ncbi:hypothetical protein OQA88_1488 [Cercophora sp. LCS_1]
MSNTRNDAAASGDADRSAKLPSYEEHLRAREEVKVSEGARRIRWALNGPLESAITIGRDYFLDPDEVPESYCRGSLGSSEDSLYEAWHPLSKSPLSEPKISSLQLTVHALHDWDTNWMENHDQHTDPDGTYDPADVLYGPLPDADKYEKEDAENHLLICCGLKRPRGKKVQLKVEAGTEGFVTIRDFASVVHRYLMGRRAEIIEAMNEDPGRAGKPFSSGTRLMVGWNAPNYVDVHGEDEWRRWRFKFKTIRTVVGVQNTFLAGGPQPGQGQPGNLLWALLNRTPDAGRVGRGEIGALQCKHT